MPERILIVDDTPQDLQMMLAFLKDDYVVSAATSGEAAIEKSMQEPFVDLILMDVSMAGMSGYEACGEILKRHPIDVIFVSANDATDEILKGFEAGGIDYVTKPFNPEVLTNKIKLAFENQKQAKTLSKQHQEANQTAMLAISSTGELSIVLNFLRESFAIASMDDLGKSLIKHLGEYGLNCGVQLRSAFGQLDVSSTGDISPLESELLARIGQTDERLMEQQQRMFVNYKHVGFVIKNMPVDDPDKCGRIRDYVMIIIEGASSKLDTIDMQLSMKENRKKGMHAIISESQKSLQEVEQLQKATKERSMVILDNMVADVEELFLSLGLSEDQEAGLLGVLNASQEQSLQLLEKSGVIDNKLLDIIVSLQEFQERD